MDTISQLAPTLRHLLTTLADQAARQSGFVQRQSPITGSIFTQTLVFGLQANPNASLSSLSQTAAALGVDISPQALEQRFTEQAATCLEIVLSSALQTAFSSDPLTLPLLARFAGVFIQDSSIIVLPTAFKDRWQGCGGSSNHADAALKLQLQLNLRDGRLLGQLHDGREADTNSTLDAYLPPRALRIADLGYWELDRMHHLSLRGCFWLSRADGQTAVQSADGCWWSVAELLLKQESTTLDMAVRLGKQASVEARLLAVRVPQGVADERRRRIRAQAKKEGKTPSRTALALVDWTVLVTNVPAEMLVLEEALVLARLRWQIELLFKLWKSHGEVDVVREVKHWRQLCELYAKLLGCIVMHWVLVVSCWANSARSLTQAAQSYRQWSLALAGAMETKSGLIRQLRTIARCIGAGCRINRRKKRPSAFQLLLQWGDACLA